jgi:stage V sporulation protein AE
MLAPVAEGVWFYWGTGVDTSDFGCVFCMLSGLSAHNRRKGVYVMVYVKAFLVGGFLCLIGQILLDKTKWTAACILVLFMVVGAVLGCFGLYEKLVDFAGAGATVPLTGFGYLLSKGVQEDIAKHGVVGILTGGIERTAAGITVVVFSSFVASLIFSAKDKDE